MTRKKKMMAAIGVATCICICWASTVVLAGPPTADGLDAKAAATIKTLPARPVAVEATKSVSDRVIIGGPRGPRACGPETYAQSALNAEGGSVGCSGGIGSYARCFIDRDFPDYDVLVDCLTFGVHSTEGDVPIDDIVIRFTLNPPCPPTLAGDAYTPDYSEIITIPGGLAWEEVTIELATPLLVTAGSSLLVEVVEDDTPGALLNMGMSFPYAESNPSYIWIPSCGFPTYQTIESIWGTAYPWDIWLSGTPDNPEDGACCDYDGLCSILDQVECAALPGVFRGVDTTCGGTGYCEGACCFVDGSCEAPVTINECYEDFAYDPGDWQGFELDCTEPCLQPCDAACPGGGTGETFETGCTEDVHDNDGCHMTLGTEVFEEIACDETVCGTFWTNNDGEFVYRDRDYYHIEVFEDTVFTFTARGSVPTFISLWQSDPLGSDDPCNTDTGFWEEVATGCNPGCEEDATFTTDCMPAGHYYFVVAPDTNYVGGANHWPCDNEYYATLTCDAPCNLPPDCEIDYWAFNPPSGNVFGFTANPEGQLIYKGFMNPRGSGAVDDPGCGAVDPVYPYMIHEIEVLLLDGTYLGDQATTPEAYGTATFTVDIECPVDGANPCQGPDAVVQWVSTIQTCVADGSGSSWHTYVIPVDPPLCVAGPYFVSWDLVTWDGPPGGDGSYIPAQPAQSRPDATLVPCFQFWSFDAGAVFTDATIDGVEGWWGFITRGHTDDACDPGDPGLCWAPPPPDGACCINNICVGTMSDSACQSQAGGGGYAWYQSEDCATFDCLDRACCLGDLSCVFLTQAECVGDPYYGDSLPEGVSCDPEPCWGACCHEELVGPDYVLACTDHVSEASCTALSFFGTEWHPGELCVDIMAADECGGACCVDGECVMAPSTTICGEWGGSFQGLDTSCTGADECLCAGPNPHDLCVDAQVVTVGGASITGNTCNTTGDCPTMDPDDTYAWFKFTLTETCSNVTVSYCGSSPDFSTGVFAHVYDACPCNTAGAKIYSGGATITFDECGCPGDASGNGVVNGGDVQCFADMMIAQAQVGTCVFENADMDGDGDIEGDDLADFVDALLAGECGPSSEANPIYTLRELPAGTYWAPIHATSYHEYVITVTREDCVVPEPCATQLTCPARATVVEAEACGADSNGTCDVAEAVACGDVICGTVWGRAGYRDIDWYEFTTTDPWTDVTLSAEAELPVIMQIISGPCPDPDNLGVAEAEMTADCGVPGTADMVTLPPGTYWVLVAAGDFYGLMCEMASNDYIATLTCTPGVEPSGACCEGETCTSPVLITACAGDFYVDEDCATFDCPAPPPDDECVDAPTIWCGASVVFDNTDATENASDPVPDCVDAGNPTQATMWYTFVGDGQTWTIESCNTPVEGIADTGISVWSGGTCPTPTTQEGCGEDDCTGGSEGQPWMSSVTVVTVPATQYWIMWFNAYSDRGEITMDITCVP